MYDSRPVHFFRRLLLPMKWEMEIEEVEAVLEKIWDLHDKLSDAIHSISRSHFLHSIKSLRSSADFFVHRAAGNNRKVPAASDDDIDKGGFVYVKDFPIEGDDESAIQEAKSLNAIRTALENLEDQLEFFHTVQTQQRAERDAAIARLEESRIVLALRLADHHGKKYKVIEEARAFVGEVHNHGKFASVENGYESADSPSGKKHLTSNEGKSSNILVKVLLSSFNFAKKSLQVDHLGSIFGNAALFAMSMLALLHLHQVADKERYISDLQQRQEVDIPRKNVTKVSLPEGGSTSGLDVLLARG